MKGLLGIILATNTKKHEKLSLLHIILFFVYAAFLGVITFLPVFLKEQVQLTDAAISFGMVGFGLASFIGSFLIGRWSDQHGRLPFLRFGLIFSGITLGLHAFIWDFWSYVILRILAGFGMACYIPTIIALARESGYKMARFTSFGSLGWLVGVLVSGLLAELISRQAVFFLAAVLYLIGFVLSFLVRESPTWRPISVSFFPLSVIKRNWGLLASFLLRHASAIAIWTLWSIFLKAQLQISDFQISIVQAVNTLTQFLLMYFLMDKGHSHVLVLLGLIFSAVTFISFTLITDFYLFLFTQVLLGTSWAFLYAGSVRYVTDKNPELGTASGMLNSTISLSQVIGPMIATVLSVFFPENYYVLMYFATFTTLLAVILFFTDEFLSTVKQNE